MISRHGYADLRSVAVHLSKCIMTRNEQSVLKCLDLNSYSVFKITAPQEGRTHQQHMLKQSSPHLQWMRCWAHVHRSSLWSICNIFLLP